MLFESSTAFFYVRGHVEAAIDLSLVAAPELFVPFVLLLIEADEQTEDIRQFQIEARAAAEIPWLEDSAVEGAIALRTRNLLKSSCELVYLPLYLVNGMRHSSARIFGGA